VGIYNQEVFMRHYEIVFLVHPDQSDQTSSILSKLDKLIKASGGTVHRSENIGNRKLAYPIQDQFKASYGLINIECNQETVAEIKNSFKFNDSIIRNLIVTTKKAHTKDSALLIQTKEDNEKDTYEEAREQVKKLEEDNLQKEEKKEKKEKKEITEHSKEKTVEESPNETIEEI
tara:strand:- start:1643 stop:2164 length:522 start_codon:yes stop_codon:yes gene_type:complete